MPPLQSIASGLPMALGQNAVVVPRLRLAGGPLLFMGSMGAILVSEALLRRNRVNLPEDVQRKRDVESVSGVSQVSASANLWFAMGILTAKKIALMKTDARTQKADLPVTLINLLPT